MKIALKSLFIGLTLAILSYSAAAAGAADLIATGDAAIQCCKYQIDCPEGQRCNFIDPDCSESLPHICEPKAADDTAIEPTTGR